MPSSACKLWIPVEELEALLKIRRSKRHGYTPVLISASETPGSSEDQSKSQSTVVKEIEGCKGRLYLAELANQGFLAMLQHTHILAEVGHEVLRRGRYGTERQTHVFALVSSRQRHTVYTNGLALTTHPELDTFSNQGFAVADVKLPPSDTSSLDQFVMEAHAAYKALILQQPSAKQTAINWQRNFHILFYTACAQN